MECSSHCHLPISWKFWSRMRFCHFGGPGACADSLRFLYHGRDSKCTADRKCTATYAAACVLSELFSNLCFLESCQPSVSSQSASRHCAFSPGWKNKKTETATSCLCLRKNDFLNSHEIVASTCETETIGIGCLWIEIQYMKCCMYPSERMGKASVNLQDD